MILGAVWKQRLFSAISPLFLLACLSQNLSGKILPDRSLRPEYSYAGHTPARAIQSWISSEEGLMGIEKEDLTGLTSSLDLLKAAYQSSDSVLLKKDFLQKVDRLIIQAEGREKAAISYILPYFYEMQFRGRGSREEDMHEFFQKISGKGKGFSCPRFRFIKNRLTDRLSVNNRFEDSKRWLQDLAVFPGQDEALKILSTFLSVLKKPNRRYYAKTLANLPDDFGNLTGRHPWILRLGGSDEQGKSDSLSRVRFLAEKKKCYSARSRLIALLKDEQNPVDIEKAWAGAMVIEGCFRRKERRGRLALYKYLSSQFRKIYGPRGKDRIAYLKARFLWNADRFAETNRIIASIEAGSRKRHDDILLGKVLYLAAQVAENQEKFGLALEKYGEYQKLFSDGEFSHQASRSRMIIQAGMGRWSQVLQLAQMMIRRQQDLSPDARQVSKMGFGLFWAGRASAEIGNIPEAIRYWRIAAKDYFSTYYGAMAHYMVERITGKSYILDHFFSDKFDPSVLTGSLSAKDLPQLMRTKLLLISGLKKEAFCEASTLPSGVENPGQALVKALVFHEVGHLLKAVQFFGQLPRSFRKNLAYGMERILFPVRYHDKVKKYSERAGIDPTFILSLIRQESVFNPRANSSAGAKGLMQLMKKTARQEARRISSAYISSARKRQLIRKVRRRNGLYDSETNIILGVHYLKRLLKRYKSVPLVLAAYNAGPAVVNRWMKTLSWKDPFYFIEMIPYNETRDYVKLILRNYFYYKTWYTPGNRELPHLEPLVRKIPALAKNQKRPTLHDGS